MIHSIYGQYDNTLYEESLIKNTGLDSILSLSKKVMADGVFNNRILLSFDLANISQSISTGVITSPKFFLNLYTDTAREVPSSYTIEVHPISQSWDSGIGKYLNKPASEVGSSWYSRLNNGLSQGSTPWTTSSFNPGTTGSMSNIPGGGTWYTGYVCSQSYDYSSTDVRVDVTSIVNAWLGGAIPNNGFLIKKSHADEISSSSFSVLQYFSTDSHTIYLPKLEVSWDDSTNDTGSLTQPGANKDIVVYLQNLKPQYKESSKIRFEVGVREKYPTITFATQSNFLDLNYLPTSSLFYGVMHADTQETVIPFDDNYTKVSCDPTGNYFNLWMDSLQPERYYKLMFKVERNGSEEYFDNNFIFKITK